MKNSVSVNATLNLIKTIVVSVFPLITFPYVSRVLGVAALGNYTFAQNTVAIFNVIGMLGISTYAVREGARLREDKDKISRFASEMFSINIISSIIAFLLLFIITYYVNTFYEYRNLIYIFSITIIGTTFSLNWLYTVFEDYLYTTIRTILFQIMSLMGIFLLVKNESDVGIYAIITASVLILSNLLDFIYAQRFCKVTMLLRFDWQRHIAPIITMFSIWLTTVIYTRIDIAFLGTLGASYNVGIYTVSTKIYNIVKSGILSVNSVLQAKASIYSEGGKLTKYGENFLSKSYNMLFAIILPCTTILISLREDIILFIAGEMYYESIPSLVILSVALLFSVFSVFYSSCVLIPFGKERYNFEITLKAAGINLILNVILIPFWMENAAAFTTLIAELYMFIASYSVSKEYFHHSNITKPAFKTICSCIVSFLLIVGLNFSCLDEKIGIIPGLLLKIVLGLFTYFLCQMVLKNEIILLVIKKIIRR